jgi:hypothetical protein
VKLSALWATLMLLYAYGDIIGFFRADILRGVQAGKVAAFEINQVFLLAVSIYILIPTAMVFLSLVLRPSVSRWANLILSLVYLVLGLLSAVGETWAYYIFLTIAESVFALAIAWYAWTWPPARATSSVEPGAVT